MRGNDQAKEWPMLGRFLSLTTSVTDHRSPCYTLYAHLKDLSGEVRIDSNVGAGIMSFHKMHVYM